MRAGGGGVAHPQAREGAGEVAAPVAHPGLGLRVVRKVRQRDGAPGLRRRVEGHGDGAPVGARPCAARGGEAAPRPRRAQHREVDRPPARGRGRARLVQVFLVGERQGGAVDLGARGRKAPVRPFADPHHGGVGVGEGAAGAGDGEGEEVRPVLRRRGERRARGVGVGERAARAPRVGPRPGDVPAPGVAEAARCARNAERCALSLRERAVRPGPGDGQEARGAGVVGEVERGEAGEALEHPRRQRDEVVAREVERCERRVEPREHPGRQPRERVVREVHLGDAAEVRKVARCERAHPPPCEREGARERAQVRGRDLPAADGGVRGVRFAQPRKERFAHRRGARADASARAHRRPVHLVARVRRKRCVRERRRHRVRALDAPPGCVERVRPHPHPVGVAVARGHRVLEHELARARAPRVERTAGPRPQRERKLGHPRHRHRAREGDRHRHPLAQPVGVARDGRGDEPERGHRRARRDPHRHPVARGARSAPPGHRQLELQHRRRRQRGRDDPRARIARARQHRPRPRHLAPRMLDVAAPRVAGRGAGAERRRLPARHLQAPFGARHRHRHEVRAPGVALERQRAKTHELREDARGQRLEVVVRKPQYGEARQRIEQPRGERAHPVLGLRLVGGDGQLAKRREVVEHPGGEGAKRMAVEVERGEARKPREVARFERRHPPVRRHERRNVEPPRERSELRRRDVPAGERRVPVDARTRARRAARTAAVRAQMPGAGVVPAPPTARPGPPASPACASTATPPSATPRRVAPFSARLSARTSTPSASRSAAWTS